MRTTYSWETSPGKTASYENRSSFVPRAGETIELDTGEVLEVVGVRARVVAAHSDPDIVATCRLKRVNVSQPAPTPELVAGERVDYHHKVFGPIAAYIVTLEGETGATLRISQIGHPDLVKKNVVRGTAPGQWSPVRRERVPASPTT